MDAPEGAKEAAAAGNVQNPLSIVLGHLNSSEADRQVCNTAARVLHRVSKQHQADGRATRRHLPLDRYYACLKKVYPDASSRPAAVPWELLAACPSATSWKLDPEQLEGFRDPAWTQNEGLAAAASKVKQLTVYGVGSPSGAQQEGLGRLLWACTQLEEVTVSFGRSEPVKPWLMLDPDSTSSSKVASPPLPLRSWRSDGIPADLVYDWLEQQQQQTGHTLKNVYTAFYSPGRALKVDKLAAFSGLEELTLDDSSFPLPPGISSILSSVTKLDLLSGNACKLEAVRALTGLRQLALYGGSILELPDAISALKQLSHLELNHSKTPVPSDLGVRLPNLQQLKVEGPGVEHQACPSLTGLTWLDVHESQGFHVTTHLTRLRELHINSSDCASLAGLPHLTALEKLDASFTGPIFSITMLKPLTRLRHLNLEAIDTDDDPASFSALGDLKQLTYLNLRHYRFWGPTRACLAGLAQAEPLPALQQLDLSNQDVGSDSPLAPWVAKLTALTSLNMSSGKLAAGDALLYLPTQLRELHLGAMQYMDCELPAGLTRLTGLEMLSIALNRSFSQLPAWLSELQGLEILDLSDTEITTEQQVLAQLPALRCVALPGDAPAAEVYGAATHLHWGHSDRWVSWYALRYHK